MSPHWGDIELLTIQAEDGIKCHTGTVIDCYWHVIPLLLFRTDCLMHMLYHIKCSSVTRHASFAYFLLNHTLGVM